MKRIGTLLLVVVLLLPLLFACKPQQDQQPGTTGTGGTQEPHKDISYAGAGMDARNNPNVVAHISTPPANMSDTSAGDGKTLTIAQNGEPNVLYPQGQNIMPTATLCVQLYEPLFRYNCFTDDYEGLLAEEWELIDDTRLRIKIREGVKCHAGYEMTANDVLWTLKQGHASPTSNWIFGFFNPEKSSVVDKYTIDICTDEPFGAWYTYLSNWSVGGIVNQQAYEEQTPDDYGRNPKGGAGPWQFVEWIAGDRIILKRFDDYYGLKPYYENLVIRNIPDDTTRTLSLEGGEVDVIISCDTSNIESLIDSPACNVYEMPSWQIIYAGINLSDDSKPWANQKVRDAMYYAADLDVIAPLAFDGYAMRADGYFPPSQASYSPIREEDKDKYSHNLDKAKALMVEAGYENGFDMRLYTCDTLAWVNLTEMVNNAWAKIGINAKVSVYDQSAHWDLVDSGDYDVFIARHTSHGNDGNYMYGQLHSESGREQNAPQYKNPEFDDLMTQAKMSNDLEFRLSCYHKVNDIVRRDKPWIELANPVMTYGSRSTLQGVYPSAAGLLDTRFLRPVDVD